MGVNDHCLRASRGGQISQRAFHSASCSCRLCLPEADGGSEDTARSQRWCCVETQSWVHRIINKNLNDDRASPVLQQEKLLQ